MKTTKNQQKELSEVLNRALRGEVIPGEYQNAISFGNGDVITISKELKSDILEARNNVKSMKKYVHTIPVKSEFGTYSKDDSSKLGKLL